MAVLSVPLRWAEVERVPLGLLFQRGKSIAREFSVAIATEIRGKTSASGSFRDRISARAFLPIQPCIQVRGVETPHFSYMGAMNLPTPSQLL